MAQGRGQGRCGATWISVAGGGRHSKKEQGEINLEIKGQRETQAFVCDQNNLLRTHWFGQKPRQGSDQETKARDVRDKGKERVASAGGRRWYRCRTGSVVTAILNDVFNSWSGSRNIRSH